MFRRFARAIGILASVSIAWCGSGAIVAGATFTPGHIYSPTGANIAELDQSLTKVGQVTVNGVRSGSGAIFNDSGNLVWICQDNNSSYEVRVREVNASGQVLRQFDTGMGSLLLGSFIDFDPVRRVYAYASDKHLTFLDANLSKIGDTANVFSRASGVAFAADGSVYATDQFTSKVHHFDPITLAEENTITVPSPYNWVLTGLDVAGNGDLLLTSFGNGAVYRMSPDTGAISQIVSNLGYGQLSSVTELPDGRLLTAGEGRAARLFSATGQLLFTGGGGDSALLYVPEPSTLVLLGVGVIGPLACAWRRRKGAA